MKKETDFTLPEEYLNKSNLIPKVEQIEGDKRKMTKEELKTDESKYITELVIKDKLKSEFEKYLKDSADYYDPREPLTERKLLQMWLDCAEPREKRIAELEAQLESERDLPAIAYIQGAEKQKKKDEDQLTKAKEIIKELLDFDFLPDIEIKKQAEQFLKDQEEEPCGQ